MCANAERLRREMTDWAKGMVVPYAEAGYPSAIPLTVIEEKLEVSVELASTTHT